ncbi:SUMF1/EgtB/PvdO family nonheme iron enzyme [Terricaulis sp.]|uniref:SUMF1/EgtB/PvdO family nonheme iron enzyme n=1 Tax=Terricaulis sp. TaxID=2768686 RepID=UPI002AC44312|nr:SUMF1/EgtB/PvdO family nonheme iron enzyme [Terricaulis sp.]MDZ4692647.1 SUMF1/EgtB/PvdO family nonheme iron enzyme [Terricaulis sp.]
MAQVFVGYRRADKDVVTSIVSALEARGFSVFWDHLIVAGDDWHHELDDRIKEAKVCLIVWSNNVTMSSPVLTEADHGHKQNKLIIAAIDPEVELPLRLKQVQYVDLSAGRLSEATYWRHDPSRFDWSAHPNFSNLIEGLLRKVGKPQAQRDRERRNAGRFAAFGFGLVAVGALAFAINQFWPRPVEPGPPRQEFVDSAFRDCADCPEMVVVPAGQFTFGNTARRQANEQARDVVVNAPFAVGKFEVSSQEYAQFLRSSGHTQASGCYADYDDNGGLEFQREARFAGRIGFEQGHVNEPAVCVSWADAQAYVQWLTAQTGRAYRLLREDEWEYAARANSEESDFAVAGLCAIPGINGADAAMVATLIQDRPRNPPRPPNEALACTDAAAHTAPRQLGAANAFGLVHMIGNVDEWVEDCYTERASEVIPAGQPCRNRTIRGGSWRAGEVDLRFSSRSRGRALRLSSFATDADFADGDQIRRSDVGFRVATSDLRLDPRTPVEDSTAQ